MDDRNYDPLSEREYWAEFDLRMGLSLSPYPIRTTDEPIERISVYEAERKWGYIPNYQNG